jgi:hypothetical protein
VGRGQRRRRDAAGAEALGERALDAKGEHRRRLVAVVAKEVDAVGQRDDGHLVEGAVDLEPEARPAAGAAIVRARKGDRHDDDGGAWLGGTPAGGASSVGGFGGGVPVSSSQPPPPQLVRHD